LVAGCQPVADEREVGANHAAITEQPDDHCELAEHDGHEYWFCRNDRTWQDARTRCEHVGAELARIDDQAENDFVRGELVADAFVGANDLDAEGQWRWSDDGAQLWSGGPTGSPVGGLYSRWLFGQPNDFLGEDCAVIDDFTGKWEDQKCHLPRDYVCETSDDTAGYPQAPDVGCQRGERDGHEYWFCSEPRSFVEAQANCEAVGMQLASIDDAEENGFVEDQITCESFIGLSDAELLNTCNRLR
jgi:YHS domain-containing protein